MALGSCLTSVTDVLRFFVCVRSFCYSCLMCRSITKIRRRHEPGSWHVEHILTVVEVFRCCHAWLSLFKQRFRNILNKNDFSMQEASAMKASDIFLVRSLLKKAQCGQEAPRISTTVRVVQTKGLSRKYQSFCVGCALCPFIARVYDDVRTKSMTIFNRHSIESSDTQTRPSSVAEGACQKKRHLQYSTIRQMRRRFPALHTFRYLCANAPSDTYARWRDRDRARLVSFLAKPPHNTGHIAQTNVALRQRNEKKQGVQGARLAHSSNEHTTQKKERPHKSIRLRTLNYSYGDMNISQRRVLQAAPPLSFPTLNHQERPNKE